MAIDLSHIADYLLTQSWQIAILVVVIAAVSSKLRNKSAHVRYLLWLIVLCKCLAPPLFTIPLAVLPEEEISEPAPIPTRTEMPVLESEVPVMSIAKSVELPLGPTKTSPMPIVKEGRPRITIHEWVGICWVVGASVFLIFNILRALRANLWLWRRRETLPVELRSNIESLFSAHGIKNFPNVWLVDGFNQPFVWGLLRGSIYLPANFLKINQSKHQSSVLGHELSHVLRFDAAVNILQVIAQVIFWFHPFVWWANRKIRQEREKCCDEMAIARLNTLPRDYSRAILEILATKYESARPVPSLAVAGPVKNIEERMKTMLRPGKKFYKHPSLIAAIVVLLLALLTAPTTLVLTARAGTKATTMPFHQAAADGDIDKVKSLISKGVDVNAKDEADRTALHVVALQGRPGVAQVLIANGADLHARDKEGCTPLGRAAQGGHIVMTELLIAKGANVNAKDARGDTPLHHIARRGRPHDIVRRLVANGADVNARNANGRTAAHVAAKGRRDWHGNAVLLLNKLGTDVKAKDKAGNTPLHVAAEHAREWVTEDLLAKGAEVNATNAKGQTPLHIAAGHGRRVAVSDLKHTATRGTITQRLLARGSNVNAVDQSQSTALHEAARRGHTSIAKILMVYGASVKAKDRHGHTPAYLALRATHNKVADLLMDKRASVSAIYFAAYLGDLPKMKNLIANGVSLDAKDEAGFTPLHAAAAGGHKNVVEYLISQDVNANEEAWPGWTALSYAAAGNHMEVVELLRAKGVGAGKGTSELLPIVAKRGYVDAAKTLIDLGAKTNLGERTALQEATFEGHKEIVELLISKGADVNAGGWTPLHITADTGRTDIARSLIAAGANLEASSLKAGDWTPLMEAAYYQKDMVSLLISEGADVNKLSDNGWTVLDGAVDEGRLDIAELLLDSGVKPNVKGEKISALHIAAWYQPNFVELLIAKGADVNAKDNNGWTPLHYGIRNRYCRGAVDTLIAKGVDVNARTNRVETILHLLACDGDKDQVQFALSKGVEINAKDKLGWTALHRAILFDQPDIAKLLVTEGANVNVKDNDGKTALDLAKDKGHTEIVELLRKHGAEE